MVIKFNSEKDLWLCSDCQQTILKCFCLSDGPIIYEEGDINLLTLDIRIERMERAINKILQFLQDKD